MKKNSKEEPLFEFDFQNKNADYSSDSNESEDLWQKFYSTIHIKEPKIEKTNKYEVSKPEENNNNNPSFMEKDEFLLNNQKLLYDPYLDSNFISRIFFLWAYKILKMSKNYKLKIEDLGKPTSRNNSTNFSRKINYIWNNLGYKNYNTLPLLRTIIRANYYSIIAIFILCLLLAGLDFFSVIIIKQLIDYFNDKENKEPNFMDNFPLWVIGLVFICTQILISVFHLTTQMIQTNFGIKSGFELNCLIFDKILNNSSNIIYKIDQGEIINYIQIDSMRLFTLVTSVLSCFISPFMILVYIYLLLEYFGLYFIPALIFIIIYIYANLKIGVSFTKRQKETMKKKDLCMKVTTEALENIKILKLYNLENEFNKKIIKARKIEMDYFEKSFYLKNLIKIINWFCPIIIPIMIIGTYISFNDSFNISVILVGLSIFSKFIIPIRAFPNFINAILEIFVSFKRIENFLKLPEVKKSAIKRLKNISKQDDFAIRIKNGCFSWGRIKLNNNKKKNLEFIDKKNALNENKLNKNIMELDFINLGDEDINQNDEKNEEIVKDTYDDAQINISKDYDFMINLKNINLEIKKGELVGIVGEVGSGKSSLLEAIIDSLILLNQKECDGIHINGKVAYVSQIPWIQNDTIRNNIIFSKNFDKEKYNKTLELCELIEDIKIFGGKDFTEIGEKGINLSRGQKMRISLARAIYNDPDIYLFDDPISSLDANISKKIMENCIINYLKDKTRVIVTNALNYLDNMDRIIYMKSGTIEWTGNFKDFQNHPFYEKLMKITKNLNDKKQRIDKNNNDNKNLNKNFKIQENSIVVKLIKDEDQGKNKVNFCIYVDYINYMGGFLIMLIVVFFMFLTQLNKAGGDLYMANWTEDKNQEKLKNNQKSKWNFFFLYSGMGVMAFVFIVLRVILLAKGIVRLERLLYKDMIFKLIKAPINLFHDIVPRGQIYNRLSKDLDNIFETTNNLPDIIKAFLTVISSFILCGIYDIYSLLFMPIIFIIGYYIKNFYLYGSRSLRRMSAISSSPILNIISETLSGMSTIKAYEDEKFYKEKFLQKINDSLNINIINKGANLWFQEQFKIMSVLYLTYLVVKIMIYEESLTPQSCSIILTYNYILQQNLSDIFYYYAVVENEMVSMERCYNYKQIIEEKESYIEHIDNKLISEKWPQKGKIEFKNFSVRYRPETDLVLKKINITINPGEKIGICGRTGSGKSTICLSLFRILEASDGQILIDNVDISKIGLHLLRNNITIIPQDPCLVEGSVKYNLDPFNKIDKKELEKVIKDVGLESNESNSNFLEKKIESGGNNLSVGQKQLICIARAILRISKIVVMDEATANIDMKTENLIQKALNKVLEKATVITVAHRIKTIINSDRILVLNNGEVKEFDSPKNLLQNEKSLFYELFNKSS